MFTGTSKLGTPLDELMGPLHTLRRYWFMNLKSKEAEYKKSPWEEGNLCCHQILCLFAITFSFYRINLIIVLIITGIISVSWKFFSTEHRDRCKGFGEEEC